MFVLGLLEQVEGDVLDDGLLSEHQTLPAGPGRDHVQGGSALAFVAAAPRRLAVDGHDLGLGGLVVHRPQALRLGHRICIVVGEPAYYRPYGFVNASAAGLALPGPVDPRRFQVLEFEPGALDGLSGPIGRAAPAGDTDRSDAARA